MSPLPLLLTSTFRILVATDSHLGYNEDDPVRGQDSFVAFREVLELARDKEVRPPAPSTSLTWCPMLAAGWW
jgi:hypothetical protein